MVVLLHNPVTLEFYGISITIIQCLEVAIGNQSTFSQGYERKCTNMLANYVVLTDCLTH